MHGDADTEGLDGTLLRFPIIIMDPSVQALSSVWVW